jgi:toxin ParE1/3/4
MASRLIWSPEAIEDIESIAEYIAKDSVYYAKSVVRGLLEKAKRLIDYPEIGRIVPEMENLMIREVFVHHYRLVYKISDTDIIIVAVIHGKRLLDNVSDRFN